ncbi:CpsD/CapB family tyrosine-protein kinase [Enterococcus cecorum]|uniref:CpsD/CapB family tyrosine-protein kinase n=1 Tax=Enterococcus cecorum TaxID=44008 RepID=UPI0022D00329|nr:CpsD/CapB family tyrosine-protein kinase [Enterococcus cecorum]MDZ5547669.1 CpsD/CapB family tyrosine-protein kinase [Enterococcus cecorum]MDZ5582085.1 CpsD/CapB family tyrosine-protein kinase [Enterococcus cecorum]MDZ5593594.1 CpsD/CapB family tyrosine-protein kinase [Enterococcus cecorum]CAI3277028.1 CpsD/CapB family tyrosine-protein kinase [Enterococcus cecorum]CAI3283024.1 CpsD/CapB family tyrosine-protein kinase [Enterococcus cecorum]
MAKKYDKKNSAATNPVNLITLLNPNSSISEQYRTVRTNLQFAVAGDQPLRSMAVVSSGPGEGKSTSSANLAVVFAQAGRRVLLVDADMRKVTVHKTFGLSNEVGLSNLVSGQQSASSVIQPSGVDNLSVMTAGPTPPNPAELLNSHRMNVVIEELYQMFDLIVFDLPPVMTVADGLIMASKTDGTVVVIREGVTRKDSIIEAKNRLIQAKARILGVIYNGVEQMNESSYYYYSDK